MAEHLIHFTVPGKPVSKGRPRLGRNGSTYTPRATRDAEETIAWCYRREAGTKHAYAADVEVRLLFVMPTRHRVDLDNLVKLALDGLTEKRRKVHGREMVVKAGAIRDDSQVVRLEAEKRVGSEPRTEITVTPVSGPERGVAA